MNAALKVYSLNIRLWILRLLKVVMVKVSVPNTHFKENHNKLENDLHNNFILRKRRSAGE